MFFVGSNCRFLITKWEFALKVCILKAIQKSMYVKLPDNTNTNWILSEQFHENFREIKCISVFHEIFCENTKIELNK